MLLGNREIQNYFETLIESGNLSHAHLFYGPEGVGKKLFVLKIAERLLGNTNSSLDIKMIDKGDGEIYISDIRDLKSFLYLTSFGKYKVAVINNAHNLNPEASNALLKVLEEPPGKSILFFITHLEKLLLPTVVSRCQLTRFRPLKKEEILNYLTEEKKVKKEAAQQIAEYSGGSLGLALRLADNFEEFLKDIKLLNKLAKAELMERFEVIKKNSADPEGLKKLVGNWFIYVSSLPEKKFARELMYLNNILAKSHFNHRLFLENFLINLT